MGDKLNILVVADVDPTDVIGGAERMLAGQLRELAGRGHRINVLTRMQPGKAESETSSDGYRLSRYSMPAGMGLSDLIRAIKLIRRETDLAILREAPDIVYVQQPLSGAGALLSNHGRRLPAAYMYLSPWSDEYRVRLPRAASLPTNPEALALTSAEKVRLNLRKVIEGWTLRRVQRILIMSDFMQSRCIALHGLNQSHFRMVPGGVDTEHFKPTNDQLAVRKRLGLEPDARVLLTVRNLHPRMGVGNLIAAMPQLLKNHPESVCIIGGTGAMAGELKAQAANLKLNSSVRFDGFIPESSLPDYYAASDTFILPTAALEGFGMVTVEALACGTPVLGTPVGATPEVLGGLDRDLILPGVEPADIANGCDRLFKRLENESVSIRSRCRAYAVENYSWQMVTNRIEQSLQEIVR